MIIYQQPLVKKQNVENVPVESVQMHKTADAVPLNKENRPAEIYYPILIHNKRKHQFRR